MQKRRFGTLRFKAMPLSVRADPRPERPVARRSPPPPRSRVRDWIATAPIAFLVVALVVGGPTQAATPTLAVSGLAMPGRSITVSGAAFPSGTGLQLVWDGSTRGMPKVTAGADGKFFADMKLHPKTSAGTHVLAAAAAAGGSRKAKSVEPLATVQVVVVETPTGDVGSKDPEPSDPAAATPAPTPAPTATPKPSPTATPTPAPIVTPAPPQQSAPPATPAPVALDCGATLQSLVNGTPSGGTLTVPACTYRETVVISKPLTIKTSGGRVDGQGSRRYAFDVRASDVTIDGFEVTGTTNPAQDGAIHVRSVNRFTLRNSYIHDTGGACVSIGGGSGHTVANNELAYCAQQGFHLSEVSDTVVVGNKIHHNNPNRAYDPEWEAGAGKAARAVRLTFEGNVVYANRGPGLWCDIDCRGVTYRGNAIFANERAGIFFEISDGAVITGNSLWENGWGKTPWGWGAGILVSSSRNVEVANNTVAWNADGISVISQNRAGGYGWQSGVSNWNSVVGVRVHDNVVALAPQGGDSSEKFMLGWLQDWGGVLFSSGSNNSGSNNRYWHSNPEPSTRFAWSGGKTRLSDFNATPGESSGTYLTKSQLDAILASKGIPVSPASH